MVMKKRLAVLLVVVLMLLNVVACSSVKTDTQQAATEASNTAATGTADKPGAAPAIDHSEVYKITAFSQVANYSGNMTGWFGKVIKDKFNIEINVEPANLDNGTSKFATKMVSGDLGDIVIFGDNADEYKKAVEAGLLLDWNKDGLVDKYGQDIKARYSAALDKNKAQYGGGTAIYGIGHDTSDSNEGPGEIADLVWGPYLRWDLYAKAGYPQINDMEDYLPVLKQMKDLEPKTADGKPVYAFSFWKDWDGSHMMNAKQFACTYGFNDDTGGLVLVHGSRDEYQDLLQTDGYYLRTLKMYFQANQMGLVDPESPSQNWDIMYKKAENGQVLFSWFSWLRPYNTDVNKDQGKGLMLVPFKNEEVYSYGMNIYGGQRISAIGKNAKKPERIMELYDWLCTDDGSMIQNNGPEGMAWNYKDGKAVLTDLGVKIRGDQNTLIPDEYGGGKYFDGMNKLNINIINKAAINKKTGEPYDKEGWSYVLNLNPRKVDTDWRTKMGATTSIEWLQKNVKLAIYKPTKQSVNTTLSDDLKQILDQVGSVIKEYSWKMVFAKNQAEFDKLQNEMITKSKGLGYDKVVAENVKMTQQLFEYRKEK